MVIQRGACLDTLEASILNEETSTVSRPLCPTEDEDMKTKNGKHENSAGFTVTALCRFTSDRICKRSLWVAKRVAVRSETIKIETGWLLEGRCLGSGLEPKLPTLKTHTYPMPFCDISKISVFLHVQIFSA